MDLDDTLQKISAPCRPNLNEKNPRRSPTDVNILGAHSGYPSIPQYVNLYVSTRTTIFYVKNELLQIHY